MPAAHPQWVAMFDLAAGRLVEVVIGSVALALRSLGMGVKCGSSEGLCLLSRDQRSCQPSDAYSQAQPP